jgi:uncharacterized membrane-anchored protein YjiN (DUF445 family)
VSECLQTCNPDLRRKFFAKCARNLKELVNHEFGNFVLQTAIQWIDFYEPASDPESLQFVVTDYVSKNLPRLSKEQYSSRVVETLLKCVGDQNFQEICQTNFFGQKRTRLFKELLFDSYGNYIAVKFLETA